MSKKKSDKIVETGMKVDFHIHSYASKHKEGKGLVDNSTVKNLATLIKKLNERKINMCAISDHDNFDIEIYKQLKKQENKGTIKKVLPAVEFTVGFDLKILHIIVLFDDTEPSKLENIQELIFDTRKGQPKYKNGAFTEEQFLEIIKKIDLNVVFIAHQKGSLSSKKVRKKDVMSLGKEKFCELVFVDYFESFEFKNRRNELFNKHYIETNREQFKGSDLRFITGSDCHNWREYPIENDEFRFTFLKCLPTFRGVAMSVTNSKRIKLINSFFSKSGKYIDKIELRIRDKKFEIPMSAGINAIIGDNSIGKSLLIHKLTDYNYLIDKNVKKPYEEYLKSKKVEIISNIKKENISIFNSQGAIRNIFENKKFSMIDFFGKYLPNDPNNENLKEKVKCEIRKYKRCMLNKKEFENSKSSLRNLIINIFEENADTLSIDAITINYQNEISKCDSVINTINSIVDGIDELLNHGEFIEKFDREKISAQKEFYMKMKRKFENKKEKFNILSNKVNCINSVIIEYNNKANRVKTDVTKEINQYQNEKNKFEQKIIDLYFASKKDMVYKPNVKRQKLSINESKIGQYRFAKLSLINEISNDYVIGIIKTVIGKRIKDINNVDEAKLPNKIDGNNYNEKLDSIENKALEIVNKDFSIKPIINNITDNIGKELSAGFNAKIYFDILSQQTQDNGIFIFDQPEDDLSQKAIKEYILNDFNDMSQNRQVILITHNPQFIVNLDVDNVVYISKNSTGDIVIKSGALEFQDDEYDILKIVADNIDGGVSAINERWKRYEKNI